MSRAVFFLILALLSAPVFANDIAVSQPDARGGWLLLENPLGSGGEGLSKYAGDPGMPAPDAMGWPHNDGQADGSYPETELWHYDSLEGNYTRATRFLGVGNPGSTFRRTLYAVFTVAGKPYVLHFDPYQTLKGYSQVLRVDAAAAEAGGVVPQDSVVLNSARFIDAPAVSPDGAHVAFRAFERGKDGFKITLRVYTTADWKLVAESQPRTYAHPVWIDNDTLAAIAWNAADEPRAPQRNTAVTTRLAIREGNKPRPGKLLRLDLADGALTDSDLLSGEFPPDVYTAGVLADPAGLGLIVARKDGDEIVAEMREPKPAGKTREIGRFEAWRGCSVGVNHLRCAGVRTIARQKTFVVIDLYRWSEIRIPVGFGFQTVRIPGNDHIDTVDVPLPQVSPEGHGGLIDLGRGVLGLLEPVMNPEYAPGENENAQLLRHTLAVISWPGCDTMRNPRVIQRLSKLVRRFSEIGRIRSTLLAFDVKIAANNGQNEKNGRMIELYSEKGRGDDGRIRTEDNLGGSWLVQSIDGGGTVEDDDFYDCTGKDGNWRKRSAKNVGKAYDDLVTQLQARKLLIFTGVEQDADHGGLVFIRRDYYHDPASGATWRTWVFVKYGKKLDGGGRERVIVRFVADLPIGTAGNWKFPHAIAQVQLRFALANQKAAADTELTFEPDRWVALPNLVDLRNGAPNDKRHPDLLLPKVFRIYQRNAEGKQVVQLKATAVEGRFDHPAQLVKSGEITPGYEVPLVAYGNRQFTQKQR